MSSMIIRTDGSVDIRIAGVDAIPVVTAAPDSPCGQLEMKAVLQQETQNLSAQASAKSTDTFN